MAAQDNYRHTRLYLTEADYARLKAAAKEADLSITAYVRMVLAEAGVIVDTGIQERPSRNIGRPPKIGGKNL